MIDNFALLVAHIMMLMVIARLLKLPDGNDGEGQKFTIVRRNPRTPDASGGANGNA